MSVFDPKWKYTQSHSTDIRKTFAKARKDLAKRQQANAQTPKLQLMRPLHNASGSSASPQTTPSTPRDSRRPAEHTRTPAGSDKLIGS